MPLSYQEFDQFFDQALEERGIKRFQKAVDELRRDVENLRSAVRQLLPNAKPCNPWDIEREERAMNEDRSFGSMLMAGSYEHSDHCVRCNPDLLQPLIRSTQETKADRIKQQQRLDQIEKERKEYERQYRADIQEWRAQQDRERYEWRDRINAQRDPVKAATPINVDE